MNLSEILAALLSRAAAACLRRRRADWARAMLAEDADLQGSPERLLWAFGSLRAALVVTLSGLFYPVTLAAAAGVMATYQWSRDEGLATLLILAGLSACVGAVRPQRAFVSAAALGAVVAAVHAFESLSGLRPAYELHAHGLLHGLFWLILILPALAAGALGRWIGQVQSGQT